MKHTFYRIILNAWIFLFLGNSIICFSQGEDISEKEKQSKMIYNSAIKLIKSGKTTEAITLLNQTIVLSPKFYEAYLLRGKCKSAIGENKSAMLDFSSVIRLNPSNGEAHFCLGYSTLITDTLNAKTDPFDLAIQNGFDVAQVYYCRAIVKTIKKKYDDAIQDFNICIMKDPSNAYYYYERGCIKLEKNDYDGALQDFTKARNAGMIDNDVIVNLSYCMIELGDYDTAIKLLKNNKSNPQDVRLINNTGVVFLKKDDLKTALLEFGNAIKIDKSNYKTLNNIAIAQFKVKNYKIANEALNLAIGSNSKIPELYYNRGSLNESTGNLKAACSDWNRAYSLGLKQAKTHLTDCQ